LSLDATRRRGFIIIQREQQDSYDWMFAGTFPGWMDIHEDGYYALTFNDTYTCIRLDENGSVILGNQGGCESILWSYRENLCEIDSYCGPWNGSSKQRTVPWKRVVLESMIGVIAVIVISLILLLRCR
jgi:hypothetical protein